MRLSLLLFPLILSIVGVFESYSQGCIPPDQPGNYSPGWVATSFQRGNRTLNSRVYYPASTAGQNAQIVLSGAPYPMIAFGHGFAMQTSYYNSYYEHLASLGYVVIAPQFPDTQHGELAQDLLACLEWLRQRNFDGQSFLNGAVDTSRAGLSGHSMGGGASLLAASHDSRIRVAAPMCPAETSPSIISRMNLINGAVCIIAGSHDGITPVSSHQQPMYDAAQAFRSIAILQGGNHTRCMDVSLFDFTDPGGTMTRAVQQQLTRRYMAAAFNLFLKADSCGWTYSYGSESSHPSVSLSYESKAMQPANFLLVSPLSGLVPVPATLVWQRSVSLNPGDTMRYTVQTSSNVRFSPLRYQSTVTDTTMQLPAAGLDTSTWWRVEAWTSPETRRISDNIGEILSPVPVELTVFSALRDGRIVHLSWTTETETSNLGFEIQRSHDGEQYSVIAFIPATNSQQRSEYHYEDAYADAAWYRLRQIDTDGDVSLTPALYVPVLPSSDFSAALYPTDVAPGDAVSLELQLPEASDALVSLWTRDGKAVATVQRLESLARGRHIRAITLPALDAGYYFLHLDVGYAQRVLRIHIR